MADVVVYVNSSRPDNTGDGLSPSTAKKTVNAGMAVCRANIPVSGHTLHIANGIYSSTSDYILADNANLNNLTVTGEGVLSVVAPAEYGFTCSLAGLTVMLKSFYLSGAINKNTLAMAVISTVNVEDLVIAAPTGHQNRSLAAIDAGICNFKNTEFHSVFYDADPRHAFYYAGSSSGSIENCIVRPSIHSAVASSVYLNTSGNVNIDNTLIIGVAGHGLQCASTGTYTVKNSIINGGCKNASAFPILRTGGSLSIGNSLVIANPFDGAKTISGVYTDLGGNTLTSLNPKLTRNARKGYILPCIDDSGNFARALEIETLLAAKGFTGTFFLEGVTWNSANTPSLREMVGRGVVEVGTHTWTHSDLELSGKLWDVTKAFETVTIDRTANTITLSGGGVVAGFRSKTLAVIKTELEALGATVTPTTLYSTTFSVSDKIYSLAKGEVINDLVAGTAVDILVDVTAEGGLYRAELRDAKALLESEIGEVTDPQTGRTYVCNSIGCPYNGSNSSARSAGIASGFLSMRGMYSTDTSTTIGKYNHAADLYRIYVLSVGTVIKGDGTEAVIRRNARALAFAVAESGLCVSLLTHTAADLSLQQWGWMLDEFASFGNQINVCSQQKFALDVREQGWIKTGGIYSKPLSDADGDYHLQPTSPCIGAGTEISGITTDIEGNMLYPPYNIGPYGAAAGALETGASDHTGQAKLSFTAVSNPTDTTFSDDHTYSLADSHQMRSVTGWEYGTANAFYNADGTAKELTGLELKQAGIGPLLWIGDGKWLAFKSTAEAKRALKVPVA